MKKHATEIVVGGQIITIPDQTPEEVQETLKAAYKAGEAWALLPPRLWVRPDAVGAMTLAEWETKDDGPTD